MNSKFNLTTLLIVLTFFTCKNNNTLSNFKYTNKPDVLTCNTVNYKLYQEALYSFEDDIFKFYGKGNPNASLIQAYSQFITNSLNGRIKFSEIISKHSFQVFNALKEEDDLWDANNPKTYLNYKSNIMICISQNIKDDGLKTTLNSLISTNFMSPKLFGQPLMGKFNTTLSDKYLATYVALDLFYAKLFDIDFSKVNFDKAKPLDFNVIPPKANINNQ